VNTSPKKVTPSIPKNTAVPSAWRSSAPGPVAITSGMTPRMKAKDVIRIGRRRLCAARTTASIGESPSSSACLANSTIRIAFLAASAMSTTRPIWVRILLSIPRRFTPIIAASSVIGTIRMIASGSIRLSNCAASTRNTNSTAAANTIIAALPASFCWKAISVHSAEKPCGSLAASASMASSAWPDEWPAAVSPSTSTAG